MDARDAADTLTALCPLHQSSVQTLHCTHCMAAKYQIYDNTKK